MGAFSRFEQIPGRARPRHTRNGIVVLAVFAAVLYFAYSGGHIPFLPKGGTVVTADFANVANVQPGKTPVRVAGVEVGKVEKVERLPDGRGVRVKMRIEDGKGVHLRRDASAHIFWRTLLGFAFYIQLDEGSSPQGLDGKTLAMKNNTTQVELDQVLTSLDKPSREGMQTIFREFEKGFAGDDAGNAIDALSPSMRRISPGLEALRGTEAGDLTNTVRSASKLMGALARNEVQLGEVVNNANTTLGVTAARSADLGRILQDAPASLDQTKSSLVRLRGTFNTLDPIADKLRPGVRVLDDASLAVRPALAQLRPALDDARPLLADLDPALKNLKKAAADGVPAIDSLDPTIVRLRDRIVPGLDKKGSSGLNTATAFGAAIASVSSSASLYDAYGYTQRFQAVNGGGHTLSDFIPCSIEVVPVGFDCTALQGALAPFLGLKPSSSKGATRKSSGTSSEKQSPAAGSAKAPAKSNPVKSTVARLTGLFGG